MKRAVILLAIALCSPTLTLAWNSTGHMTSALIAYRSLTPKAKKEVDGILRHHPDYDRWVSGLPRDQELRNETVFLIASIWPDLIKSDARFTDRPTSASENANKTDGRVFPDTFTHRDWHFVEMPFSLDGTKTTPP